MEGEISLENDASAIFERNFIPTEAPRLEPATTVEGKKMNWDLMRNYFDHIGDSLGLPLDDRIKDAVVALNLLGFTTSSSCSGHVDEEDGRIGRPYLSF